MVNIAKKNELSLYVAARREQWNQPDRRGHRPFNCDICQRDKGYARANGCDEARPGGPRPLGPYMVARCPNWYLRRTDQVRDEVIKVYQDYKAGVLRGWPDRFAGAVVEGVRLVNREVNAAEAELMKARAAEQRSRAGGR